MTWHDISVCCCQKFSDWSAAIWVYQFSIHEFLGVPSSSYIVPLSLRRSEWYQSYCFDLFFNTIPSIHLVPQWHTSSLTLPPQPATGKLVPSGRCPNCWMALVCRAWTFLRGFLGGAWCYRTQHEHNQRNWTKKPNQPTNKTRKKQVHTPYHPCRVYLPRFDWFVCSQKKPSKGVL